MSANSNRTNNIRALLILALLSTTSASGAEEASGSYLIQPGDILNVSVWKEPDLQQQLLVRPDGGLSFPLAGDMIAAGRTVGDLQQEIVTRIEDYIPDPVVTVQVLQSDGNTIYVLGKVNRPGVYIMNRPLDVMQALALAGGLAVFAAENDISILRRTSGSQTVIFFEYGEVEYGRELGQNVLLEPGDVVVVP